MNKAAPHSLGSRGPADHEVRSQIVTAATEHFARFGYDKTTVSDLAKEIGFSKAYIYKFFESKQAIGEEICAICLGKIEAAMRAAMEDAPTASERFRQMFKALVATSVGLFFQERKLYDIAASAASERWNSSLAYEGRIRLILQDVIREGRELGEFERKTPMDETVNAIYLALHPYINPLMLQYGLDRVERAPEQLASLILRSLSP